MPSPAQHSPLTPPDLPVTPGQHRWGRLYGAARGLAIARTLETHPGLGVVITPDTRDAETLARELEFFLGEKDLPVLTLPDWETLPYDLFSPHEDIISQRLETLYRLPDLERGILVVPVNTLMQRIAPRAWLQGRVLMLKTGARLDRDALRRNLEQAGYRCVSQVMEHGEFAVRGSLIDLFPMGSNQPYRVDLLDDEIESIRSFDPETQLSQDTVDAVRLLPAHEFPLDEEAIKGFRQRYRTRFEGDPQASVIYRDVSQGTAPAGYEYYLPLFFHGLTTLFDYLPGNVRLLQVGEVQATAEEFLAQAAQRHEQCRHDRERPILDLPEIFLTSEELKAQLSGRPGIRVERPEQLDSGAGSVNFDVAPLPDLRLHIRQADPAASLKTFLDGFHGRVLIAAESAGRREFLLDTLRPFGLTATPVEHWQAFLDSDSPLAITVAPIDNGMRMPGCGLAIITEPALFGERARQERRRKRPTRDADAVISNLTDLHPGSPVVHEEHGVGRYLGLQKLAVGGQEAEFLTLEYAGGDKLYVPVSSLHLVSRYTGADTEHAPLHRLGGEQWVKIRRKAAEKARDVAAELLEIYARRAARKGQAFDIQATDYAAFADSFPFEETPDQARAIESVLDDMASQQPMDRVGCGDVGFGKTEVAMRAAFVAANSGQQVVVLVPTTLLAQQHYQNFTDRFADWPIRIESLSRFRSAKETKGVLEGLADGRVDI
ncbi:MAG TPA: CarD family transcriptional regulator, partial [Thioalkalivibrio sp.]|nr:CarD family transcriptional regulator [Thioalkalivibrio sp.]